MDNLFSEFPPVSAEEWKGKINDDLKEKSFENLVRHSEEGFGISPFYTREDVEPLDIPMERQIEAWQIRQDFLAENFETTNRKILDAINNGADSIGIRIKNDLSRNELEKLLAEIPLYQVSIHFLSGEKTEQVLNSFLEIIKKREINPDTLHGSFDLDPLGESEDVDFKYLKNILHTVSQELPLFISLTVHSQPLHMEGKNISQQLAGLFSKLEKYYQGLSTLNYQLSTFLRQVQFSVPIGTDYFMEIAKLRALRYLYNEWQKKYGIEKPIPAFIQAQKSWKLNNAEDPYLNILQHTTEAMAAVIGGCDVLNLRSIDKTNKLDNDFFERISRNIQLILKHESHFGKVTDPARGSYYIEKLTAELSKKVSSKV